LFVKGNVGFAAPQVSWFYGLVFSFFAEKWWFCKIHSIVKPYMTQELHKCMKDNFSIFMIKYIFAIDFSIFFRFSWNSRFFWPQLPQFLKIFMDFFSKFFRFFGILVFSFPEKWWCENFEKFYSLLLSITWHKNCNIHINACNGQFFDFLDQRLFANNFSIFRIFNFFFKYYFIKFLKLSWSNIWILVHFMDFFDFFWPPYFFAGIYNRLSHRKTRTTILYYTLVKLLFTNCGTPLCP
jgi:hypothetical protein